MSAPLIAACLWVVAATLIAMLPMRRQILPGLGLLAAAPVLLVWIGAVHGPLWSLAGVAAFVSMFRRPLGHLLRRMLGRAAGRPEDGA